jgi:hypothetical protein
MTRYRRIQNASLHQSTTNWTLVGRAPSDNGTTKAVVVTPPTGSRFYRLSNQ